MLYRDPPVSSSVPPSARLWLSLALLCATGVEPCLAAQDARFLRGDANADGAVDISDAVYILESLFLRGAPFSCADAADINDDGAIDVTDAVHCVRFLFAAGPPPPAPHPGCGEDPTADTLSCLAHPPCESGPDLCLSLDLLEELVTPIPGFSFCLPAGLLELPVEAITVSLCPSDLAQPCGAAQIPGCAVELASFTPIVDIPSRAVGLRVAGRIDDLPVRITESLFGTSAVCTTTFRGADRDAPFQLDILIPLETAPIEPGVLEIVGVGPARIDNVEMRLDSSGGILCALFAAGQDLVVALLVTSLEALLAPLAEPLGGAVVGLRICE